MPVEFEWQVGDEEQRETIADLRQRRLPRWVRKRAAILTACLLLAVATAYAVLRLRYERARRAAELQIQSVIALEARAYSQGDRDLFLGQQDRAAYGEPGLLSAGACRLEARRYRRRCVLGGTTLTKCCQE